jgi:hypothetical protein
MQIQDYFPPCSLCEQLSSTMQRTNLWIYFVFSMARLGTNIQARLIMWCGLAAYCTTCFCDMMGSSFCGLMGFVEIPRLHNAHVVVANCTSGVILALRGPRLGSQSRFWWAANRGLHL